MGSYNINSSTRCYACDYSYVDHEKLPDGIPKHDFYPAVYLTVTGKSEENTEQIPEEKNFVLLKIYLTMSTIRRENI